MTGSGRPEESSAQLVYRLEPILVGKNILTVVIIEVPSVGVRTILQGNYCRNKFDTACSHLGILTMQTQLFSGDPTVTFGKCVTFGQRSR